MHMMQVYAHAHAHASTYTWYMIVYAHLDVEGA